MPDPDQAPSPATVPVFIHSLYRSGSTWLFDRFRHATSPYWCYQEPYHEATMWLQTHPDDLLGFDHRTSAALRHPVLDRPYFAEVHALREHVAPLFHKGISFDSLFDTSSCLTFHAYTRALIEFAPQRPLLQCCRSFGRVRQIRSEHGGIHIHLWREPREQWWSYQIQDYFDITSLAILQANSLPVPLQRVADRIGFRHERRSTFEEDYTSLLRFPIDAAGRYMAFYALWLYSQWSNFELADCNISLDALAGEPAALQACMGRLQELGVDGVDLSACAVPHSQLGPADDSFFDLIEQEVRQLFLDSGYAGEGMESALERQRAARALAQARRGPVQDDGSRGRSAALRYADTLKAARQGEHAALQRQQAVAAELDALRVTLGREQAEWDSTRAALAEQRDRRAEFEQRALRAEQLQEQLACANASHMELARSQVQLAQQQVELAQNQGHELRLESTRLEREIQAARESLGVLREQGAADFAARTDAITARVEALAEQHTATGAALSASIVDRLDSLSNQHQQDLHAQRSAWREDLAERIDDTQKVIRETVDQGARDLSARNDALIARVEELAATQARIGEARLVAIAEQLAALSDQHQQDLQTQRSAWREDLAEQIGSTHKNLLEAVERSSSDFSARNEALIARVEDLAATQARIGEARSVAIAEQLAALSNQHEQDLQTQRSAWREDLAERIDDTQKVIRQTADQGARDFGARTDALIERFDSLAARQAADNSAWRSAMEHQAQTSTQALQELSARIGALNMALQSRDERIRELEQQAVTARDALGRLLAFRDAVVGTRLGRWLAARKSLDTDPAPPPRSDAN